MLETGNIARGDKKELVVPHGMMGVDGSKGGTQSFYTQKVNFGLGFI